MSIKKLISVSLAAMLTASVLAGCGADKTAGQGVPLSVTQEHEETENRVSVPAVENKDAEKDDSSDYADNEFVETPDLDEYSDTVSFPEGTRMIEFSGEKKKTYISDDYGAYEGNKYILLVDKNVELPGNYAMILDDIIESIERVSGLSFYTERTNFTANMVKTYGYETPWAGLKSGGKMIIQLNNSNRNPFEFPAPDWFVGYVSTQDNGLYTFPGEEVWESDYDRIIEVLIRSLFSRKYPDIAESDNADEVIRYYVIEDLEAKYPDFKRMVNEINYDSFRRDITAENIEQVWVEDHLNYDSWYERSAVETLFLHYMMDTRGTDFYKEIVSDNYADRDMTRRQLANRIKALYGDDVFTGYVEWVNGRLETPAIPITLSGDENAFTFADGNCYVEGEKCFIYIEKGLSVPCDILVKTDAIVAALEKKMWPEESNIVYGLSQASNTGSFYGISNNGKLPIVLANDDEHLGLISAYYAPDVNIYDYGMETGDREAIDFETIAHECSHAVMDAGGNIYKIGKIMAEGSADYYARFVLDELGINRSGYSTDYYYKTPINADTAEALFLNDFSDVTHADRGAEYAYGCYLTEYLIENFGDEYLGKITRALGTSNVLCDGNYGDNSDREQRLKVFKRIFGDDLFTGFGAWYVKNY